MNKHLQFLFFWFLFLCGISASAQISLETSPYIETFNTVGAGLPAGVSIRTGATATVLGTTNTLTTAATAWNNTTGAFKNFASATGLLSSSTTAEQSASPNRALGLRQTAALGDPGGTFVFQLANTSNRTNFSLSFNLQSLDATSPRTATWQVDYGFGAVPTSFTSALASGNLVTGGSAFSNNTITVNFNTALDNQNQNVWIRIITLSATGGAGNRPSTAIDDFTLSWASGQTNSPSLTVLPALLSFPPQSINTNSTSQNYTLSGANLTAATTVTATAPFQVSKDNTTFGSIASFSVAELATEKPVYVRFNSTSAGTFTSDLVNASSGATSKTVNVSASAFDPNNRVFNFNTCSSALSDGWWQFSVLGAQTWACTTFGRDPNDATGTASAANGVQINGFANGTNVLNEDWLISPSFNTSSFTYPLFSFWSRTAFNGGPLKLRVSTNYTGSGSPSAATWTDLDVLFPNQASDVWTQTRNIDLSAFKGNNVTLAFVYTSTNDDGARWTLDDINLLNSATPPPPSTFTNPTGLSFAYQAENTSSIRTFNLTSSNLTGSVTLSSSDPVFQLSKDGTTFGSSISFTSAEASGTSKQVSVRFSPSVAFTNYSGSVSITSPGSNTLSLSLSGNTYNTANTLEVVNWNIEWFGSTQAGLGPTNKAQQEANVKTILTNLNADIYGLLEVVDVARIQNMVSQMNGYSYVVSDFGSYADNAADPDYAGAQKLGFIYRTNTFSNISIKSFFRCTEAQNCPEFNYWSSGRFPFVMEADVTLNGVTKRMSFVLLHAKANTSPTATSYTRRQNSANVLKAKLDAEYPTANFVILGDFNDDLDQTITAGISPPISSYSSFTADPANYIPLTLPLSLSGKKSTVSYNDVIDHVMVSNEMNTFYIPGTAEILTSVAGLLTSYGSSTTDHYPVLTRFAFGNVAPTINTVANQVVCTTSTTQTIALSGISAGPESGQTTSLSVSSTQPDAFTSLTVVPGSGGTGTLNYQLRNSGFSGAVTITITVRDNGGTSNGGTDQTTRTFTLTINSLPFIAISSDKGTQVSKGDIITLTASGGTQYSWISGVDIIGGQSSSTLQIRPKQSGTYKVMVTNSSGCSAEQTITLNVVDDYFFKISNVLTPNGDGRNDKFVIQNIDYYPGNELKIFDKAGRVLYSQKGYANDWDGTHNGNVLTQGTYYYLLSFNGSGRPPVSGYITLIRN